MVLAWVAGASSGLAASSPASSLARKGLSPVFLRCSAIAFGLLLSSYAAAWIVFQSGYQGDLRAEQAFCRFGICAVDSAMDEASASAEKTPDARRAQFLESLRRDPVNPLRWSDLGTEFSKSGDTVQAERCFVNALALGPEVPPVLLDAGEFYHKMRQDPRSLQLRALILAKTSFYDAFIFQSYTSNEFKLKEILQYGLPAGKRTAQAFFDYAITAPDYTANTMKLWDWLVSQGYSDDRRLKAYVTLLMNKQRYEDAAQVWSLHLGTQRNGYRQSTWIFDGDFELEGSDSPFDWDIRSVEGLRVTRDKSVAHSGAKSLRIEFEGKGNVSYADTSQIVVLPPGAYRFRAYVQTQEITTDQGIGFRFSNPDGHAAAIFTEVLTGTNGWRKVEQRLCITPQMRRTDVRIVRRRSNIFFRISGTAWVDSVELARIAETCSAAP